MTETTENQKKWFTLSAEAVAKELQVDPAKGLSSAEAKQRAQKYGRDELAGKKKERYTKKTKKKLRMANSHYGII